MEAIFLACGAGGPQLKRNPLGAQPETIMRLSSLTLLVAACHSPGMARVAPTPLDSAGAVRLAIAAVADTSDTLVYWTVAEYSHTSKGYVIAITPRIKPEYAKPHRVGNQAVVSQLMSSDGGGKVHLSNNGKVTLIEVH